MSTDGAARDVAQLITLLEQYLEAFNRCEVQPSSDDGFVHFDTPNAAEAVKLATYNMTREDIVGTAADNARDGGARVAVDTGDTAAGTSSSDTSVNVQEVRRLLARLVLSGSPLFPGHFSFTMGKGRVKASGVPEGVPTTQVGSSFINLNGEHAVAKFSHELVKEHEWGVSFFCNQDGPSKESGSTKWVIVSPSSRVWCAWLHSYHLGTSSLLIPCFQSRVCVSSSPSHQNLPPSFPLFCPQRCASPPCPHSLHVPVFQSLTTDAPLHAQNIASSLFFSKQTSLFQIPHP